ncbi:hypothetical protein [uncultured Paraglaciecola sp.]|uniref:hypothetical protein n=1 Tax=uncultured Paraglaciecola sp. TaxID=1765024 RepID=UPI0030D84BA3|tara:strand:+ start:12161 stop:12586 length:426 start_codon:yes stop_codon:yes gene_type:complete
MTKYFILFLVSCLIFIHDVSASTGVIVVANTADKSIKLNRQQVRNLFMGGAVPYELEAVSLPPDNQTRVLFNTKVVGLTESRIQSYWAQMRFTGRKRAPKEINSESLVLEYIENTAGAVGYLPEGTSIPDNLTIIYTIYLE